MWFPIALIAAFASQTVAAPSFPIEMDLEYCYEGSPCGYATWTFYADGTMEDDLGGEGNWLVSRGNFNLVYSHGSEYRGTLIPAEGCVDGVNLHADGRRGEFSACL